MKHAILRLLFFYPQCKISISPVPSSPSSFPLSSKVASRRQEEGQNLTGRLERNKDRGLTKMTYVAMVITAVINLAERGGSSLKSIRKYISSNFTLKKQQTASFNALTLKAINKAVAESELERNKNSFRLSNAGFARLKDKERMVNGKKVWSKEVQAALPPLLSLLRSMHKR